MPRTENSIAWLETALAENLRPVGAPAELWDSVQLPRMEARGVDSRASALWAPWRLAITSAVAAMLVLGLWGFGRANQEFRSHGFRSPDPLAIRAWVQDRCGFALPLSPLASPAIRLSEVRLQKNRSTGREATELAFNVENRPALLQISRADAASAREDHHALVSDAASDAKSVSWVAGGRIFTLACTTPEDLRIACSLCHVAGAL